MTSLNAIDHHLEIKREKRINERIITDAHLSMTG